MFRAVLAAVALGIIVGQATLDYVFPEEVVTQGYDPATWRKCPDRKPVKLGKHKAWWYCGPDADGVVASSASVAESAATRSAPSRSAGGRGKAKGGR